MPRKAVRSRPALFPFPFEPLSGEPHVRVFPRDRENTSRVLRPHAHQFFEALYFEQPGGGGVHTGMGPLTIIGLAALRIQHWPVVGCPFGQLRPWRRELCDEPVRPGVGLGERIIDHDKPVLAACVEAIPGRPHGIGGLSELFTLSLAATALIVLPTFVMQVGLARTAPLTAQIIRALGPVCVFALEQLDPRMAYSVPTLLCIGAHSVFVIASNVAHGWRDRLAYEAASRSSSVRLRFTPHR